MITVPNPCPKKWNEMTPANGGNFCKACEKVVVDLREASNKEIIELIRNKGSQRLCGRFYSTQLIKPKPRFRTKKFLAAIFIIFSYGLFVSCGEKEQEHEVVGDVEPTHDSAFFAKQRADSVAIADSMIVEPPAKLSKADSTRISDSLEKTKNHVRDFE